MGFLLGLILIAVGAILTWAVNATSNAVDLDVVGVVLMIVGLVLFLLGIMFWRTWWGIGMYGGYGPPPGPYGEGGAVVHRRYSWPGSRRRTTTYVEDDAPPPGPPP
ncbi:MAG: hypothetical protein M3R70_07585 [Actinomycetota bacterium]|nr:hypothetical protein [Actinomycetota bacterium]